MGKGGTKQMYEIDEDNRNSIYQHFDFPDDISGLNPQIIRNTLEILEFLAEMSDSYAVTKQELAHIDEYRRKHNL